MQKNFYTLSFKKIQNLTQEEISTGWFVTVISVALDDL